MDGILTPRRQGLAVIAALEAKGDQAGLEKAAAEALDNGLTVSEAKEALSQLYAYTGFPRSLNALGTLQKVLTRREAAGIKDDPGREITVFVDGLGDSSVDLGLFCYVNSPDFLAAKWQITEEIKLRFDKAGISIPFPQVHVHMEKEKV